MLTSTPVALANITPRTARKIPAHPFIPIVDPGVATKLAVCLETPMFSSKFVIVYVMYQHLNDPRNLGPL